MLAYHLRGKPMDTTIQDEIKLKRRPNTKPGQPSRWKKKSETNTAPQCPPEVCCPQSAPPQPKPTLMPWESPEVSARVPKSILLRLPEPLKLKLDYVLDHMPGRISQQKFILELVEKAVEEKLQSQQSS